MKKLGVFLLLILLTVSFASAQLGDFEDRVDDLEDRLDNIGEGVDEFNDDPKKVSANYLKQEWKPILEKEEWGRVILVIDDVLDSMNPVIKLAIGFDYSLTWFFFLSFGLWLFVVLVIYWGMRGVFNYEPIVNFVIGVVIASIGGHSGMYQKVLDELARVLNNPWIIILSFIAAAIILYIYVKLTKYFSKYTQRRMKEEKEQEREWKEELIDKKRDIELGIRPSRRRVKIFKPNKKD